MEVPRELVIFDCEMSGTDPRFHHIIEIGAVKIDTHTGELLGTFVRLVKFPFGAPYEKEALRITGFDYTRWKQYAIPLTASLREFKQFIGSAGLAAWGCATDIEFLSAACRKTGVELNLDEIFDIQTVASRWGVRRKLSAAAETLLIATSLFHRATVDAVVTACIFCKLFGLDISEALQKCLGTDFRSTLRQLKQTRGNSNESVNWCAQAV